jgi:asparagine synthase (glutamine-hydrolysing)
MDELLSAERIRKDGIFEWSAVHQLRMEHLSGRRNHSHQLWSIMMFQAWQERWLRA